MHYRKSSRTGRESFICHGCTGDVPAIHVIWVSNISILNIYPLLRFCHMYIIRQLNGTNMMISISLTMVIVLCERGRKILRRTDISFDRGGVLKLKIISVFFSLIVKYFFPFHFF